MLSSLTLQRSGRRHLGAMALACALAACSTNAAEGEGGAGGGGGGSGGGDPSTCGAASDVGASEASWESLPLLAAGDGDNAGQCGVSVDHQGAITVWGSFASGEWGPPQRLEVHRYDGTQWQLVGGAPVADGLGLGAGHAVDDAGTHFALVQSEGVMRLFQTDGAGWNESAAISPDLELLRLTGDRLGRPVVLALDGERARVFRRAAGAWSEVGEGFTPGAEGVVAPLLAGDLASDCQGRLAATLGGHVFWADESDAWQDLGAFVPSGMAAAELPRLSVGSDARPVVAWRSGDPAGDLLFASRFDPSANAFVLLDSPFSFEGPGGSYAVPLVDDAGRVFMTWRESTVYVAELREGSWQPFAGDGDAAMQTQGGTLPAIALLPDGLPVVCWESIIDGDSVIGVSRARAPE